MNRLCLLALTGLVLAPLALPAAPRHEAPHVHGVTEIDIALDGGDLQLDVHGPEINFTGFEHAPGNDAESKLLNNATYDLRVPDAWLTLPVAAQCARGEVKVDAASTHSAGGHSDMSASYRFHCAQVGQLDGLDIGLLARFPHTNKVVVNIVGGAGSTRTVLENGSSHVALGQAGS